MSHSAVTLCVLEVKHAVVVFDLEGDGFVYGLLAHEEGKDAEVVVVIDQGKRTDLLLVVMVLILLKQILVSLVQCLLLLLVLLSELLHDDWINLVLFQVKRSTHHLQEVLAHPILLLLAE